MTLGNVYALVFFVVIFVLGVVWLHTEFTKTLRREKRPEGKSATELLIEENEELKRRISTLSQNNKVLLKSTNLFRNGVSMKITIPREVLLTMSNPIQYLNELNLVTMGYVEKGYSVTMFYDHDGLDHVISIKKDETHA